MSEAFDKGKKDKSQRRNMPLDIYSEKPLSRSFSPAMFRDVATEFLENCLNYLLPSVKRDFDMERNGIIEADYMHFFFVSSFFLEFHLSNNKVLFF
jgi:hypothetical protein